MEPAPYPFGKPHNSVNENLMEKYKDIIFSDKERLFTPVGPSWRDYGMQPAVVTPPPQK